MYQTEMKGRENLIMERRVKSEELYKMYVKLSAVKLVQT